MINEQIDVIESGLARLARRLPEVPEIEMLIGRLIVFLGRDISTLVDRLARPRGLTETDLRVLMELFTRDGSAASPSEISVKVVQSPANMTRISDHLVERGLITRSLSEHDRRRWVLGLTPAGKQLVQDMLPSMFNSMRRVFAGLTAAERARLMALLKAVAGTVDTIHAESAGGDA